jgi:hypothetical protein
MKAVLHATTKFYQKSSGFSNVLECFIDILICYPMLLKVADWKAWQSIQEACVPCLAGQEALLIADSATLPNLSSSSRLFNFLTSSLFEMCLLVHC